jgi:hypothetical protein
MYRRLRLRCPASFGRGQELVGIQRCYITPSPVTGFCDVSGMGHLLGYAGVSTTDQLPHLQVDGLERAGYYRVFTETARGPRRSARH